MRNQRGQTLIETVIVLPIILLVLFGAIYFTRFGVVNERSQLAVRYGGLFSYAWVPVPNCTGGSCYSVSNIYDFYSYATGASKTDPVTCPTPASGAYSNTAPFPGPASGPYFQPDQIPTQTSPCVLETSTLGSNGSGKFFYNHNFSATVLNTQALVDVPSYLQDIPLLGSASSTVSATAPFVHSAYPALILCKPAVPDTFPVTGYTDVFYALNPNATPPPQPSCPK